MAVAEKVSQEVEATGMKVTGRSAWVNVALRAPKDCPANKAFCFGVLDGACRYARLGWTTPGSKWEPGQKVKVRCEYAEG